MVRMSDQPPVCPWCRAEMRVDVADGPGPFELIAQAICTRCGAMGPEMRLEPAAVRALLRDVVREQRRRKLGRAALGPRARKRAILEAVKHPSIWYQGAIRP